MTYALYPQGAGKILRGELKEEALPSPQATPASSPLADLPTEFSVDVDGEIFNVKIASVMGKTVEVEKSKKPVQVPNGAVVAPMQGMILALKAKVGKQVKEGDVVLFGKYSGTELKVGEKDLLMLKEEDILGIVG